MRENTLELKRRQKYCMPLIQMLVQIKMVKISRDSQIRFWMKKFFGRDFFICWQCLNEQGQGFLPKQLDILLKTQHSEHLIDPHITQAYF